MLMVINKPRAARKICSQPVLLKSREMDHLVAELDNAIILHSHSNISAVLCKLVVF